MRRLSSVGLEADLFYRAGWVESRGRRDLDEERAPLRGVKDQCASPWPRPSHLYCKSSEAMSIVHVGNTVVDCVAIVPFTFLKCLSGQTSDPRMFVCCYEPLLALDFTLPRSLEGPCFVHFAVQHKKGTRRSFANSDQPESWVALCATELVNDIPQHLGSHWHSVPCKHHLLGRDSGGTLSRTRL